MRVISLFMMLLSGYFSTAQSIHYNLFQWLSQHKLITRPAYQTVPFNGEKKEAITTQGVVWLKGVHFETGIIDVDVRGRDVEGSSFLGMAFSGTDSNDLECLYFRPFNFKASDALKKQHMVQYMSLPDHEWNLLRKTRPLVFEQGIEPSPDPNNWFHATIRVSNDSVQVFINHSPTPSLAVKRFRNHTGDQIGLWSVGLPGDFDNLEIH